MLPSELSGKYEPRGTLGAGAMGTVIEAFDRMIERRVAVKLVKLPSAHDPDAAEQLGRFRREAQAAGRLSHPNIVGVFDYGENAETAWIVMELVEGGSLKDMLSRNERMAVPEVARVMEQVLAALAYSHGRGVVHRDIKPANIMLAADRTVKIADFGIARIESSTMTQVGTVMGTPSYMAPEQLRGEPVDARADIWAAGVVLYQLLTGEKPFDGNYTALMHRVLNSEPPPPSQLAVTVPRGFDAVIARALAKRPEDRFPTAAAFAEAIRAAANGAAAEPAGGFGFAGAGKLPGLDETLVAGPSRVAPPPRPQAAPAPPPAKKGNMPALLGGGAALLVAAGIGAFFLIPRGGPPAPVPPAIVQVAPTPPVPPGQVAAAPTPDPAPPAPAVTAAPPPGPTPTQPPAPMPTPPAVTAAPPPGPTPAQPPAPVPTPPATAVTTAPPPGPTPTQAPAPMPTPPAPALTTAPPPGPTPTQPPAPMPVPPAPVIAAPAQPTLPPTRPPAAPPAPTAPPSGLGVLSPAPALPVPGALPPAPPITAAPTPTPTPRPGAIAAPPTPPPAPAAPAPTQQAAIPVAPPVTPQPIPVAPPRVDFRAAAAAAASAAPCSLLDGSGSDSALAVSGLLRRGGEVQIRRVLAERGVPAGAATLRLSSFDGPYCGALDVIRQVAAGPDEAPRVSILGTHPLQKDELLRLDVEMPGRAGQLYVSYLMKSNEIAHLVPSHAQPAGARVRLGEPRPGFPGWVIDEPYGTDMIIVFASERPLFPQPRPVIEPIDDYVAALASALRAARAAGVRVSARAVVLETVERR